MMSVLCILLVFFSISNAFGNNILLSEAESIDCEDQRAGFLANIMLSNSKANGWNNIMCVGRFSNDFFVKLFQRLNNTFTILSDEEVEYWIDDVVPYHPNFIIISCSSFEEFESGLKRATFSPYWHPLAHIILYCKEQDDVLISDIFYAFWYYKAINAIIIEYNDSASYLRIYKYSPYVTDIYQLDKQFGCWKTSRLNRPVTGFNESFYCEEGCRNMTNQLRSHNLATCIGFSMYKVRYDDMASIKEINLFENKCKDLHGFVFNAQTVEVLPFLKLDENPDGSYNLSARDGMIWLTASHLMNFGIDLRQSKEFIEAPFNFEVNIQMIYTFARREVDLILFPIYQFDVIIVDLDLSIAYKESGVCVLSHRADYETILFDFKLLENNYELVIEFIFCFFIMWFVFFIYHSIGNQNSKFDQAGKAFINTMRSVLSISIQNPPSDYRSYNILLGVIIWSFFAINFATQATIISFFTAYKRGKEVDTFEDIIDKGYPVEGMASPDMMLPETEERFLKINSKLVAIHNMFECFNRLHNESKRFCLIDCSVGRYLETNSLNAKGEQYLHIASKDRFHSHYLNMIFHKHSPMTETFNKYLRIFFEAGLIKKWEQYRYNDIREEAPIKPLGMDDLIGIFKGFLLFLVISALVFCMELIFGATKSLASYSRMKLEKWKRTKDAKSMLKFLKIRKNKRVNKFYDKFPQTSETETSYFQARYVHNANA